MRLSHQHGAGEVTTMPGCSQMAVLHGSFVDPSCRNQGLGLEYHEQRKRVAFTELHYDCLICTVISTNLAEKKILRRKGWKHVFEFQSSNSGNTVEVWICRKRGKKEDRSIEDERYDMWEESLERDS